MAKAINGTPKADQLTVNESNVTLNAGKGNDTITIKKGKNSVIHGDAGNDKIYINGGSNNDIYGDAGKDTIFISKKSKATIKEYTAGSDTMNVTGTITKTSLNKKNLVINVGKGVVTLENAAAKAISVKDDRGSYSMSKTALVLGKDFKGTMDATKFLATVKTIDGRKAKKAVNITGNAKANTIYAGKAGGTIKGGKGNDTIYAGAGKDTFVYANGDGKDTIKNYAAGKDMLQISSGSISKTAITNGNKDFVFTVENRTVTLTGAAAKTISLKDSRGSYTISKTAIKLNKDFKDTISAEQFLSTVTTIDGKNTKKGVSVYGNDLDNIIYGGSGDDTLYGGSGNRSNDGNDTLTGGDGKDTFIFVGDGGKDVVTDYTENQDSLYFLSGIILNTKLINNNKDILFTIGDRHHTITLNNAAGKAVTIEDWTGTKYTVSETKIVVQAQDSTFDGYIEAGSYFPTITTIDARKAKTKIILYGNEKDNIIYAGKGNDYIEGGLGNDVIFSRTGDNDLYGGDGNDTFVFESISNGESIVYDYEVGLDIIKFDNGIDIASTSIDVNDVLLNLTSGGSININNAVGQEITFDYGNGNTTTRVFS